MKHVIIISSRISVTVFIIRTVCLTDWTCLLAILRGISLTSKWRCRLDMFHFTWVGHEISQVSPTYKTRQQSLTIIHWYLLRFTALVTWVTICLFTSRSRLCGHASSVKRSTLSSGLFKPLEALVNRTQSGYATRNKYAGYSYTSTATVCMHTNLNTRAVLGTHTWENTTTSKICYVQ